MALIASGTHGSGPGMVYEIHAEQTAGSGNNRTIKLTLNLKCGGSNSASWFGFPVEHRFYVNGSWSTWSTTKGTESWYGGSSFRSFSNSYVTNVGTTSSKSITVGFETNSYSGSNDWDLVKTGSFSVGATNVAPTLSGTITADGTTANKIIPENQTQVTITSPAASDTNLSGYRFAISTNGGGYTENYKGADRTVTRSISGGEGTTYKYSCYAYDAMNATSATIYSNTLTKNTMTGPTLASSSSIGPSTSSISFSWGAPSNTNGNGTFSYAITCTNSNVTVQRGTSSTSADRSMSIAIVTSAPASGAYILKSDLIKEVGSIGYKGTLTFKLSTTNAYGTTKESTKAVVVDLRANPNSATGQVISTVVTNNVPESTIYQKVTSGTRYFLPNGSGIIKVKWTPGSGNVSGETVTQEVYVAYGTGGWTKLVGDLPISTNFYNHIVPVQTVSQKIKYLIRTVTTYGYYKDAETAEQTLHYYNQPSLSVSTIVRGSTTASVGIVCHSNTSIPVQTVGSWLTTPATSTGNLTTSQSLQTISVTKLTDGGTYTLKITYNDNTGFTANQVANVAIGQNSPVFFVNKYGIGVGGAQADAYTALSVKGAIATSGMIDCSSVLTNAITTNSLTAKTNATIQGTLGVTGATTLTSGTVTGTLNVNGATTLASGTVTGALAVQGKVATNSLGVQKEYHDGQGYYNFTNGYLITTNIPKTANTMTELYITGNGYTAVESINTIINCYVYNSDIIQRSNTTSGYPLSVQMFFNSSNYLCFWFTQPGNYMTFRFKLCTGTGVAMPSYTVSNSAKPSGITSNYTPQYKAGSGIVSRESNPNGECIRYGDGTQICTKSLYVSKVIASPWGSVFASGYFDMGNWSATFVETPVISVSIIRGNAYSFWVGGLNNSGTLACGAMELYRGTSSGSTACTGWIQITGIGRWRKEE